MEYIDGKRGKIAYCKTVGDGPGVIFLGGFMSDMTGTKATYLEKCCQEWCRPYIRFDYFGHGASEGRLIDGDIGGWLEDTLLILDKLTEGPQVLVGSSMGGWLMVLAALKRSHRIQGLVGIAAAPDFVEDLERLTPAQHDALKKEAICYLPSQYGNKPYPITRHLIEEGKNHRVLEHSIALNCPVRLLHGLADTDVAWHRSLQLARCFTSNDVIISLVKEGDHRLSHETHLKLLAQHLQSVLDPSLVGK
jgi:pimeloyl-ACP methyl ester carboxylesterase